MTGSDLPAPLVDKGSKKRGQRSPQKRELAHPVFTVDTDFCRAKCPVHVHP